MTEETRELSELLTVAAAMAIIDREPVRRREVELGLGEAAGHFIAEGIRADRDQPPFDKSLVDGFAVQCADATAGVELPLAGDLAAGSAPGVELPGGRTMAIATGAALPAGADAVVPIEQATRVGDGVRIEQGAAAGRFVSRRGSDCRAGEVVLPAGARMGPAGVGAAAAVGTEHVKAFALPRVAVVTTGDEVIRAGTPTAHQIRDANGPMLRALVGRMGYPVADGGHAADTREAVRATIERAFEGADVLLVAGGMSVGQRDFVPSVLRELGFEIRISKLRIKPGKPFVFGVCGDRYAFGLPGNPVSAFVCTLRLASRLLTRLAGGAVADGIVRVPLAEGVGANGPREFYLPGTLEADGSVRALGWKGSADVFTLARADVLIIRPEFAPAAAKGNWRR